MLIPSLLTPLLQIGFQTSLGATEPMLPINAFSLVFKLLFVVVSLLYVGFAIVVVRQVHVMKNTLITNFSPIIQVMGYLHLLFAIGVFILMVLLP